MGDRRLVGIEQNPATGSRWAELARAGHQVMQFKDAESNRYVANVVDGRVTFYQARVVGRPPACRRGGHDARARRAR